MTYRRFLTEVRTLATDRRHAAVHEAGHFVVAGWAGVRQVGAWIGRSATTDFRNNRSWVGQMLWSEKHMDRLSERRRMMVAVAGAFAVEVWEGHFDPDPDDGGSYYLGCPEEALCDPAFMSPTDWRLADHDWGDASPQLIRAAESAIELLEGELWQPLIAASRTLIRDGILLSEKLRPGQRREIEDDLAAAQRRHKLETQAWNAV
jgi:hypothetical protein